jgi:hypothetical protein
MVRRRTKVAMMIAVTTVVSEVMASSRDEQTHGHDRQQD